MELPLLCGGFVSPEFQRKRAVHLRENQQGKGRGLESNREYDMMKKMDLPGGEMPSRREKRGD